MLRNTTFIDSALKTDSCLNYLQDLTHSYLLKMDSYSLNQYCFLNKQYF